MIDMNVATGMVTIASSDLGGLAIVYAIIGLFFGIMLVGIFSQDIKKKCFIYFNKDKKMTIEEANKAYHDFKYDLSKFKAKGE